jgi:hypothetical protein
VSHRTLAEVEKMVQDLPRTPKRCVPIDTDAHGCSFIAPAPMPLAF